MEHDEYEYALCRARGWRGGGDLEGTRRTKSAQGPLNIGQSNGPENFL